MMTFSWERNEFSLVCLRDQLLAMRIHLVIYKLNMVLALVCENVLMVVLVLGKHNKVMFAEISNCVWRSWVVNSAGHWAEHFPVWETIVRAQLLWSGCCRLAATHGWRGDHHHHVIGQRRLEDSFLVRVWVHYVQVVLDPGAHGRNCPNRTVGLLVVLE